MYVINSLDYGDESDSKKKKSKFFRPTPFLFDNNSKTAESSFEVYFIDSEENGAKTYNYGFTIDSTGVREEWLNCKAKSARGNFKTIFYRHDDEYDFSGIPTKSQENLRIALEKETLIVSLGAKLKIAKLKFIRDWFIGINKLRKLSDKVDCTFVLFNGTKRLIKRRKLDEYIEKNYSI